MVAGLVKMFMSFVCRIFQAETVLNYPTQKQKH